MIVDNALANCKFLWDLQSGDTGRRWVEHRSFLLLRFTHQNVRLRSDSSCGMPKGFSQYQQG